MHAVIGKVRQDGLGLVELLVGIVISLMVAAATVYVFIGNSESGLWLVRSSRASEQLRDVMVRMERDIRRAGYQGWRYLAAADVVVDPATSPNVFDRSDDTSANTSIAMLNCDVEDGTCEVAASVADCDLETICNGITFAYNRDDDGTSMANPPTIDREVGSNCPASAPFDPGAGRSEWFGFRFFQGRIQMRTGTKACGPEPDPDDWADITDDQIVALGGFRLVDECVGIIDEVGPGGAAPDGDVFEDTDEDGELTCQDLCEAGTLDEGDFVVTAPRVLIELSGRSARIESAQPPFQMSQVVDLPNFGIRPVPWGGICR